MSTDRRPADTAATEQAEELAAAESAPTAPSTTEPAPARAPAAPAPSTDGSGGKHRGTPAVELPVVSDALSEP
ncbi:hypothetical protein ABZZ19_33425, partial [Streptomyces sp. NPDC006341]